MAKVRTDFKNLPKITPETVSRLTQNVFVDIYGTLQGKISPKVQDDSDATFTKIMTRENGFLDLNKKSADESESFIRAMQPWPVAWTTLRLSPTDQKIHRLKIHKAHIDGDKLVLDEVQLEGKEKVSWKQFKEGYKDATFVTEG